MSDVEVKFGADTSSLKKGASEAEREIKGVGNTASGLKGTFSSVAQSFKGMFSGTNFGDVATKVRTIRSEMKELVDGASHGNIQMGILGRTFAEAAEHAAPLAAALMGVAVALGAMYAVKKVLEFGKEMGDVALDVEKASQKLGINVEKMQEWHGVAEQVHMSSSQMDMGFTRLERSMYLAANGGKQQSAAFKQLGIDVTKLKSPSDALIAISEKFKTMDDGPKKTALAMQLMGRAGAQMIPVLNQGKEGLEEMMKVSEDTGSVMSKDLIGAGLAVDEQFNQMHLLGKGLKNMFFDQLAPAIYAITSGIVSLGKQMIASYKAGGTVYYIMEALGGVFKVLATIVIAVAGTFVTWAHVAVAAVESVIAIVRTLANTVSDVFGGAMQAISEASHGNWSQAWNDAKETGKRTWNDLKGGAKDVGQTLEDGLTKAMGSMKGSAKAIQGVWSSHLPKPKMPVAAEDNGKGKKDKKPKDDAKKQAEERLRAYLEELDAEQDAAKDDYAKKMQIEDEKLAAIKKVYGEDSKEYQAELRKKQQMERDHAEKLKEIERQRIQHIADLREIDLNADNEIALERINTAREEADEKVRLGQMSATKRAQAEIQFLQQEQAQAIAHENVMYQIKVQAMRDQLALLNPMSDAYREMNQKIETAERQHVATMRQIDAKGNADLIKANNAVATASVAKWKSIVQPITSAFGNIVTGILTKATSLRQGLVQAFSSILSSFISMGIEMLTNWIATQLGIKTVHAATQTAQTATDAAAAVTQRAVATATNMAEILSLAPVAGAGAFAATAAIPIIGPALAPGAAAAAMAAVSAMAPLAVAKRGYDIPGGVNPLTQLHEKEMVLPAHIAEPLRESLRSAGPRSTGSLAGMSASSAASTRSDMALRASESMMSAVSAMPTPEANHLHLHGKIIQRPKDIQDWFKKNRGAVGAGVRDYRRYGGGIAA